MGFVVFVLATVMLAFRSAQAVIDFSSYAANGVTAYCKISRNDSTSSPYENLKQSNAGKCPVLIHLSVEIDSYTMTSSIFDVTWTAAVNRNLSTPGFRCKAINGKTAVRLASVYACKYGAACVGDEIIHPVTVQHREVHELDIQSGDAVELTSFRLEIPSTGTFMIIGEVRVEVGDSTDSKVSNIVRSIVFQRVRGSPDGILPPGTIKPAGDVSISTDPEQVPKQTTSLERVVSKIPQWTPQSSVVEITGAKLLSKLPSDTRNETVALVLIALVGLVAVAIFFVYGRRRNEAPYSESGEGVDVSRSDFVMQSPVPAFHNRPPVQPMPAFHYSGTGDVIPSETINVSSFRGDSEVSVSYSDDRESPVFSSLVDESMIRSSELLTNKLLLDCQDLRKSQVIRLPADG